jgi:radical SAM protein with 4Fe4S-binding SPASM domain
VTSLNAQPRLFDVDLNVTARCNLRCDFCSVAVKPVTERCDELSLDEIRDVLAQLDRLDTQVVRLVGGEPFVRRDIEEILRALSGHGFFSSVLTNATVLKARHLDLIRDCGVDAISFSVDGHTAELHDASRGMPRAFERLTAMVDKCNSLGIRHRMMTAVTSATLPHLRALSQFAARRGFESLSFILLGLGGAANSAPQRFPTYAQWSAAIVDLTRYLAASPLPALSVSLLFPHEDPTPIELQEPLQRAGLLEEMQSVWRIAPTSTECWGHSQCVAGRSSIAIMPNGDVFGCDLMRDLPDMCAGNVRRQSIEDIFARSPVLRTLRNSPDVYGRGAPDAEDSNFSCGQCRAGLRHMKGKASQMLPRVSVSARAPLPGSTRRTIDLPP